MAVFTIQEGLSEKERIKILLFKKDDRSQVQYVFNNAKNIFKGNEDSIQDEIIPIILDNILKWPEEVQVSAGQMFDLLLKEQILLVELKPQLKVKCQQMIKIWSASVLLTWIEVYMQLDPTSKEFADLTIEMSQRNQPEAVRCGCL